MKTQNPVAKHSRNKSGAGRHAARKGKGSYRRKTKHAQRAIS